MMGVRDEPDSRAATVSAPAPPAASAEYEFDSPAPPPAEAQALRVRLAATAAARVIRTRMVSSHGVNKKRRPLLGRRVAHRYNSRLHIGLTQDACHSAGRREATRPRGPGFSSAAAGFSG